MIILGYLLSLTTIAYFCILSIEIVTLNLCLYIVCCDYL
jgi:hypothetical protein